MSRHFVDQVNEEIDRLREQVTLLRNALLALSQQRQHGPCWCDGFGSICVGTTQCKQASKALGD